MMTTERSTKIVNFMTPGAGVLVLGHGHIIYIVKCIISLNLLLYSEEKNRQTKCKIMMTKEGSTKIVNFMAPGRNSCARA